MARTLWRVELLQPRKLIVRRSPVHRWGVFAAAPISQWEVLEECPYYAEDKAVLEAAGRVYDYTYGLDNELLLLSTGFSGLYNHSDSPNTSYEVDRINEVMRHYALRDVAEGEELTLDYGADNAARFAG